MGHDQGRTVGDVPHAVTWTLFLQIPAVITKGIREIVIHSCNSASGRDLDTTKSCVLFLFFTFFNGKFPTYRKIEECNERLHTHHLK